MLMSGNTGCCLAPLNMYTLKVKCKKISIFLDFFFSLESKLF